MTYNKTNSTPQKSSVYIEVKFAGDPITHTGSGAIVGDHTIITASHVLWNDKLHEGPQEIRLFPAISQSKQPSKADAIQGSIIARYTQIHESETRSSDGKTKTGIYTSDVPSDFAIIDTSANLSQYGKFAMSTEDFDVKAFLTGYDKPGHQQTTKIEYNPEYNEGKGNSFQYTNNVASADGTSGGPLWRLQKDGTALIVGTGSTQHFGHKLTAADIIAIHNAEVEDAHLWLTNDGSHPGISGKPSNISSGSGSGISG